MEENYSVIQPIVLTAILKLLFDLSESSCSRRSTDNAVNSELAHFFILVFNQFGAWDRDDWSNALESDCCCCGYS